MTTMDICYCVLILAGAFCLVALGVLFIRTSTAIKQTGDTVEMAQDTLKRVDKVLDDVNYLNSVFAETEYNKEKSVV